MKIIGISLDDVLRKKTYQFGKIYQKYINPDIDLNNLEITTNNFEKLFNFPSHKDFLQFLYYDYSYEIFAEAGLMGRNLPASLNMWHLHLYSDYVNEETGEHDFDVLLTNTNEHVSSIGYSHSFIAKLAPHIRQTYFPEKPIDTWNVCDILVTTDPYLLENKPEGKITIKIETDYNKDIASDYTYSTINDFLDDYNLLEKLK